MRYPSTWGDLAALCAVLATAWAATAFVMHALMSRYFASRSSVAAAEARIAELEIAFKRTATHADIALLNTRMTDVGNSVAGLEATMTAVKHTTDLLLRHQLGET